MSNSIQTNWQDFQNGLKIALSSQLNAVIEGGLKDLEGPVQEIVANLTQAAKRNNKEAMDACKRQLKVIGEQNKARLKKGAEGLFDFIVNVGLESLTAAARAGLSATTVK